MKSVVILWVLVLLILLFLTITQKDHTSSATATVLESDCLNIKGSNPCVVKVKYSIDGLEYIQQLGVKPTEHTLVGKVMDIRYNRMLPNVIREHKNSLNLFMIPTLVWFLLGICVLYFMYNPVKVS